MDVNQLITAVITNGIGAVCAAAVLWFAYYRETKTIPDMIKAFTEAQQGAQSSFDARNNKVVDTFAGLIREERSVYQRWHDENRTRLEKLAEETKENRHYIRDLANQVGLRQAVEKEREKQAAKTAEAARQSKEGG